MYLDDPGHRLYEKLMESHFGNHPLSMSILGSAESIQKLERDQMARYFKQRYGPGNMRHWPLKPLKSFALILMRREAAKA